MIILELKIYVVRTMRKISLYHYVKGAKVIDYVKYIACKTSERRTIGFSNVRVIGDTDERCFVGVAREHSD